MLISWLLLPFANRQIHAFGFFKRNRYNLPVAVTQPPAFRGKVIPRRVGAVTDINRCRSTLDAVEQQKGE